MSKGLLVARVTEDGAAVSRACWLVHVTIIAGGGTSSAILYDNNAASGTVVAQGQCAQNYADHIDLGPDGVYCSTGVYVDLSTASAVLVYYRI